MQVNIQPDEQWEEIGSGTETAFIGSKVTKTKYGEVFKFKFGLFSSMQKESPKALNTLFATKVSYSSYYKDTDTFIPLQNSIDICREIRHSKIEFKFPSLTHQKNIFYISTLNPADSLWQRTQREEQWEGREEVLVEWVRSLGFILYELRHQKVTHNRIDLKAVHLVKNEIYLGNFIASTKLPKKRIETVFTPEEEKEQEEFRKDLRDCQSVAILFYRLLTGFYPYKAIDLDHAFKELKENYDSSLYMPSVSDKSKKFMEDLFRSIKGEKYQWPDFFLGSVINISEEKLSSPRAEEINPEVYLFENIDNKAEFNEELDNAKF